VSAAVAETLRAQGIEALSATPAGGGASARMWHVTLPAGEAVLRCPRAESGGMAIGAGAEARVLRAATAAGVPAPRVLAEVAGTGDLDAGYLMERLDGEALPGRLLRDEAYASARSTLVDEAAAALARIHAVQGDPGVPVLGAADQLDLLEGVHRSFGVPVPAFELALRWLRGHVPAAVEPALVHGDFRLGNLLVAPDGLVAVLDWELAHLGDPAEDLGWLCARPWRFGGPGEAAGLGSRDELLSAYASAGGSGVDPERLHFWEVLASLKWGVICQMQAARHTPEHPSLEHAAIGRRVTESELDLLVLLEEAA
jgi:aminoglycoside phosphotransferase (APT) family kinase protein